MIVVDGCRGQKPQLVVSPARWHWCRTFRETDPKNSSQYKTRRQGPHNPLGAFKSNFHALAGRGLCRSQTTPSILADENGKPDLLNEFESSAVHEKIAVSDREKITEIYHQLLEGLLQTNLKKILKEWIRVIAPKEQSTHPYNGGITKKEAIQRYRGKKGGDLTKPWWWLTDIVHCQPDHIIKSG